MKKLGFSRTANLKAGLVVILIYAGLGSVASAAPAKVGGDLSLRISSTAADEKIPVIVRMADPLDIRPFAVRAGQRGRERAAERSQLVRNLKDRGRQNLLPLQPVLTRLGIHPKKDLWLINGAALDASPAEIDQISRLPQVASISLDQTFEIPEVQPDQITPDAIPGPSTSNADLIQAPAVWEMGYLGQGVTVAIVDSGVDANHPDLFDNWRGGQSGWFDPNNEHPSIPHDQSGHGTQVAGIVVGGGNSGEILGIAPAAEWIGVKIFDDAGVATFSAVHAGFQWLLDPDGVPETDDAPEVVNNSWGFETSPDLCDDPLLVFQEDVQILKAAGMAVVFSAGNTGPTAPSSTAPASYPESFAVGSVGTAASATTISDFSARGPSACDGSTYPEVVAPGYGIRTTDLTAGGAFPNSYATVFGTSFAAPHASGAMALLINAFPGIELASLETSLMQSATDYGPVGEDNSYGFGLIDSLEAFGYLNSQTGIAVLDTIGTTDDQQLPFGSLIAGGIVTAQVSVENTGSIPVQVDGVDDTGLLPPFSIENDFCSGQFLETGASCRIDVRFFPQSAGQFSNHFDILTSLPGRERITIEMTGAGLDASCAECPQSQNNSRHPRCRP